MTWTPGVDINQESLEKYFNQYYLHLYMQYIKNMKREMSDFNRFSSLHSENDLTHLSFGDLISVLQI